MSVIGEKNMHDEMDVFNSTDVSLTSVARRLVVWL